MPNHFFKIFIPNLRPYIISLLIFLALLNLTTLGSTPQKAHASSHVKAFPTAEGFGAQTKGGRGGRIIYVTSLADSGPGTLREALTTSGPRIILFKVAGTIHLKDDIPLRNPNVTIAGQTAPGQGVQIRGGAIEIYANDVIIRHLKSRPGDEVNASDPTSRDAIAILGWPGSHKVSNVIIDHSTLIWGPDIGGPAIINRVDHVTIQNSIMGEGLYISTHNDIKTEGSHAMGANVTQINSGADLFPRNISFYQNLFTTSNQRMPQFNEVEYADVVNNVIYNWGILSGQGSPRKLNLMNNMFIKGPLTRALKIWHPFEAKYTTVFHQRSVYDSGNETVGFTKARGGPESVYTTTRFSPFSITSSVKTPQQAYDYIVQNVGATKPVRDEVDKRIINNLVNRTGEFVNGVNANRTPRISWPTLASGPVPPDSDNDGIPNTWETAHNLNPQNAADGNQTASNGYTNIENYINELAGDCIFSGCPATNLTPTPDAGCHHFTPQTPLSSIPSGFAVPWDVFSATNLHMGVVNAPLCNQKKHHIVICNEQ